MKRSISLFALFALLLFSYQNCGDVGGTSAFDTIELGSEDLDNSENNTGILVAFPPDSASIDSNGKVQVSGACQVSANYLNTHSIQVRIFKNGQVVTSQQVKCQGGSFYEFQDTLSQGYDASRSYSADVTMQDPSLATFTTHTAMLQAPGMSYPSSIAVQAFTPNNNRWYSNNQSRTIENIVPGVGNNDAPYVGVSASFRFKIVNPIDDYVSLVEFVPHANNLYRLAVVKCGENEFKMGLFGVGYRNEGSCVENDKLFKVGNTYYLKISVVKTSANQMFYKYELRHNGEAVYRKFDNTITGNGEFGFTPASFRLGLTNNPFPASGYLRQNFERAQVRWKTCGYTSPMQPDTSCSNFIN
tara:strand:+ start:508 stop:1581 length:1074 start_codon:yes stop_codon:yes gene_type:complete